MGEPVEPEILSETAEKSLKKGRSQAKAAKDRKTASGEQNSAMTALEIFVNRPQADLADIGSFSLRRERELGKEVKANIHLLETKGAAAVAQEKQKSDKAVDDYLKRHKKKEAAKERKR